MMFSLELGLVDSMGNYRKLFKVIRVTSRKIVNLYEATCETDRSPVRSQQRRLEAGCSNLKCNLAGTQGQSLPHLSRPMSPGLFRLIRSLRYRHANRSKSQDVTKRRNPITFSQLRSQTVEFSLRENSTFFPP